MNKNMFMKQLKAELRQLPADDLNEVLYDYKEHFSMGLSEGRSEEEIAKSLGNPKVIAKEIKANYMISKAEENYTVSNMFRAIVAVVGLGFFNLIFVFGPVVGITAGLFGLMIGGLAISFSGVALIVAAIINPFNPDLLHLNIPAGAAAAFGVGLIPIGVIWVIGCMELNKLFFKAIIKYLKTNVAIIVNRRQS